MEISLENIFNDFINTTGSDIKRIFEKYCLGSEIPTGISYDEYIKLLRKSLEDRNDQGHRRVAFNKIDPETFTHKPLNFYEKSSPTINSLYVAKQSYPGNYTNITLSNYEYYTGIVFLIHNDIDYDSINLSELVKLASAWYDYSIKQILGVASLNYIYRYANSKDIYYSNESLTAKELRQLKIYRNHIFGKNIISHE